MIASKLLVPSRRRFLTQAGLLGLTTLPWPALAETSSSDTQSTSNAQLTLDPQSTFDLWSSPHEPLTFTAYRNDSRLGFHRIGFVEDGRRLTVDIEIVFDVKLAFIPLYRYRHSNREVWDDGRLISLDSETDDNGESYRVKARAEGDRLLVDGSGGKLDLPGDTLTTSYWHEAAMISGEWLGTQEGQLARSEVTKKPVEMVMVEGQSVEATPYDLIGDITCTLWYRNGRWVKLRFVSEDGSIIDYRLELDDQSG